MIFKNQSHLRNLSWLLQIANGSDDITEILLKVALNTLTLLCQMKVSFITIYNSEAIGFLQNHVIFVLE